MLGKFDSILTSFLFLITSILSKWGVIFYQLFLSFNTSGGLDETNVLRNVRKVENILIKSGLFNVEGKKKVKELDSEIEVLVVDVTEHEVERPKKADAIALRSPQRALHQATEEAL
jgi:hypothetical protein